MNVSVFNTDDVHTRAYDTASFLIFFGKRPK